MSSIIRIGLVVDNNDPKGVGRVRWAVPGESTGPKEGATTYKKWDIKDPFCASPFLPTNINFIPEKGQAIKVISYDPDNETINQEYIAGPFATSHDWNSQIYSEQMVFTSYGVAFQQPQDIFKEGSEVTVEKESQGSIPKKTDYAISGKYGSDLLFTENGLQLRGGKLYVKDSLKDKQKRKKILEHPLMSDTQSRLYLKKFGTKKESKEVEVPFTKIPVKKLNYVVEYDVDDLVNPTEVRFYIYKVKDNYGETFLTSVFNSNTAEDLTTFSTNVKLINTDNSQTTPTFVLPVGTIKSAYIEIRTSICSLNDEGIQYFVGTIRDHNSLHPFYFRPSKALKDKVGQESSDFLTKVSPNCVKGTNLGAGLVFDPVNSSPKPENGKEKKLVLKTVSANKEQSFSALVADKTYFLSTDTNEVGKKTVPFNGLDKYDLTQDDYLTKIEPNTYALVRGETLVEFLKQVVTVIERHRHNPTKTMVTNGFEDYTKLKNLVDSLESDILNKSIRIN
jgi:hypothetical protein